ncbi:proline dehydrogenase family protein [Ectobacillus polymachus]|uniref:proline dehydrogenase family protein n=1 Tax=Ectobacillus polymachus TaxID=1508806 RepID=UPI003A85EF0A
MNQLLHDFFLLLSKNKTLIKIAKRFGLRFGASRFVAGETIQSTIAVIRSLNKKNLAVTVDYLGEFINDEHEAREMADQAIAAIYAIGKLSLQAQLSIKLTSLGLDLSENLALFHMRRILKAARENGVFVTIDMEDYTRCQRTLDIFRLLKAEYDNVGTVLQAYLFRSEKDMEELNEYHPNLRIVKGAYKESPQVAFPDKKDVDENYKRLVRIHLLNGNFTAIATHDDSIIEYVKQFTQEYQIPRSSFEFQMLYGIRPERQAELANEGYNMRVYVPYGKDWYGYFMRRLAERPANVKFVLKSLFKK